MPNEILKTQMIDKHMSHPFEDASSDSVVVSNKGLLLKLPIIFNLCGNFRGACGQGSGAGEHGAVERFVKGGRQFFRFEVSRSA